MRIILLSFFIACIQTLYANNDNVSINDIVDRIYKLNFSKVNNDSLYVIMGDSFEQEYRYEGLCPIRTGLPYSKDSSKEYPVIKIQDIEQKGRRTEVHISYYLLTYRNSEIFLALQGGYVFTYIRKNNKYVYYRHKEWGV